MRALRKETPEKNVEIEREVKGREGGKRVKGLSKTPVKEWAG